MELINSIDDQKLPPLEAFKEMPLGDQVCLVSTLMVIGYRIAILYVRLFSKSSRKAERIQKLYVAMAVVANLCPAAKLLVEKHGDAEVNKHVLRV